MFCPRTRPLFYWYSAIADYLGAIFQLTFVIFFVSQNLKRNSEYATPYFSMLILGYTVAFIYAMAAFCSDFFDCHSPIYHCVCSLVEWYFLFMLGFWNFSVGLYRCTAIALPFKHNSIWLKIKYYVLGAIIIFPFLVHGHSFSNIHCKLYTFRADCKSEHFSYMLEVLLLNSFLTLITLICVFFAISRARSFTAHLSSNAKVERRLILQTIFSSAFQIFFYLFFTSHIFCTTCDLDTWIGTSLVFYVCQHYSMMVIMLLVSPRIRRDFLKFYKIHRVFNKSGISPSFLVAKTVTQVSSF